MKIKYPNFRKTKKWSITNHRLHRLMKAHGDRTKDLAAKIGRSQRRVQSYLYEGVEPPEEVIKKINEIYDKSY